MVEIIFLVTLYVTYQQVLYRFENTFVGKVESMTINTNLLGTFNDKLRIYKTNVMVYFFVRYHNSFRV